MAYSIDGSIYLLKKVPTGKDSRGRPIYEEIRREVFAQIETASQSEFYNAGQSSIQAEYVFKINPIEYDREKIAEYEGEKFNIYRKYQPEQDILELYAAQEVGLSE